MNLAAEYRPKTLKSLVGQTEIKENLSKVVETFEKEGKLPGAFGFFGMSGNGKTTLARILAQEINGTTDVDYFEENCGVNKGIDNMRGLIAQSATLPQTKKRFIMLDEAHKLTSDAMSTLMKPLEEPRPHVVWVIGTNYPDKIPFEIMSRLRAYRLEKYTSDQVKLIVQRAAKKAGYDCKEAKINKLISKISSECFSPREAINSFDRHVNGGVLPKANNKVNMSIHFVKSLLLRDHVSALKYAYKAGWFVPSFFEQVHECLHEYLRVEGSFGEYKTTYDMRIIDEDAKVKSNVEKVSLEMLDILSVTHGLNVYTLNDLFVYIAKAINR